MRRLVQLSLLMVLGVAWLGSTRAHTAIPTGISIVFDEALATGWQNWSWSTAVAFDSTAQAHTGTKSTAVTFEAWGGFSLHSPGLIPAEALTGISFWVYGGTGGAQFNAGVTTTDGGNIVTPVLINAPAGQWTQVQLTMAQLGNPSAVSRINLQESTGVAQATFYLDDITLNVVDFAPPGTVNVTIDTDQTVLEFSARNALGTNYGMWGVEAAANSTFLARSGALGNMTIRLPGGSMSQDHGAINCELGAGNTIADAWPCNYEWAMTPTDFIEFLSATGRDAIWTINTNVTSGEAAALVAFFNGDVADQRALGTDHNGVNWRTVGYWAQLRASHGNAAPVGIKYWDFGNETYGSCVQGWEVGWTCDGAEYINGVTTPERHEGYLDVRAAMKAVDPTIMVGVTGLANPTEFNNWTTKVLTEGGDIIDYLAIHPYSFVDVPNNDALGRYLMLSRPQKQWPEVFASTRQAIADFADGRDIPIMIGEYNLSAGWPYDPQAMMTKALNMLFIADTTGQIIQGDVLAANHWLLNGNVQTNGTDYGLIGDVPSYTRSPQYYAFHLWQFFGNRLLEYTSDADAATQISFYAGSDGHTISLMAINKTGQATTTNVQLRADGTVIPVISGSIDVAQAASLDATTITYNGQTNVNDDFSNAQTVELTEVGETTTVTLPAYSITLLRFATEDSAYTLYNPLVLLNK